LSNQTNQQGKKFFLPYVRQEVEHLDHCVYHLDGKVCLQHLDELLAIPGIDCIQWVPGDGQPRSIEWMDLLKKIQAAGKSVWIYDWTPEEIRTRFRELDPAKVVFSVGCASQDEGEQLLRDVRL
jgi:5-methyltetrahydrofolate--homocysteine methyltransferase